MMAQRRIAYDAKTEKTIKKYFLKFYTIISVAW